MFFANDGSIDAIVHHKTDSTPNLLIRFSLMSLLAVQEDRPIGITSIPRLIMLVGDHPRKPFGFSDQFLAYQCQANRFVTVIKYVSDPAKRKEDYFNYDYMISEINQAFLRCTLTGNLKKTVNDILKTYQSDLIILEDSGKADLSNLMREVTALGDLIRFDSLTTVIDSFTAEKTIEDSEEAQKQVMFADVVLLDQKELLDEIRMQNLIRILRKLNPRAPVISAKSRTFDPSLVYGINLMSFNPKLSSETDFFGEDLEKDDICDDLCAIRCEIDHAVDKQQFFKQIEEMPDKVFRIEGLLRFKNDRFPVHLQYVGGRYDIKYYPNPMFKNQFVVIVGRNLGDLSIRF